MIVVLKVLVALLAFVMLVFGTWIVLIMLRYFAILMTGVLGFEEWSYNLKVSQRKSMEDFVNVFKSSKNKGN